MRKDCHSLAENIGGDPRARDSEDGHKLQRKYEKIQHLKASSEKTVQWSRRAAAIIQKDEVYL